MHLVDLQAGGDKSLRLELHPRLTVVQAGSTAQERLVTLLGRAYVLAGREVTGTVDGGGFLTPFDPTAVVSLDLVGEGLDVIGPSDLPPPDPTPRDAARAAAAATLERRSQDLETRVAELDGLVRMHEATAAAVDGGSDERAHASEQLDDVTSAISSLQERGPELDGERSAADLAVATTSRRLEELRDVRGGLGRALGPCEDGAALRNGDDTTALAHLVDRAASLGALTADQVDAIRSFLGDLRAGTAPMRADAQELATAVADVESAWQRAASLGVEGDATVVALVAQRADIAENHELLVGLAQSGVLGETAKAQIDAAHVAVVRAGRGDADAAVAAEVEVLSRYGFDSYLDYTIATSTRSVGQAVEAKLAELDDHVDHLDRALDDARAAAAEHLERLAAEREPAQQKVTDLLGYRPSGSSLEHLARLPEVPVAVTRLTLTVDEAAEQAQLELVRSRDAVAALEAERDDIESRRRELESRRAELDTRIVELDDVLERASAKLAVLEDRRRRATLDAETAESEVESAAAALDHLLRTDRSSYSTGDVPAAIDALLARVEPPSGRVLPVVLVDVFEPFEADAAVAALDALAIRSEHCQLIYVTNDARICDWARTLDPARGRFESVAQGRWSPRRLGRRMLGRRNRSDHGISR